MNSFLVTIFILFSMLLIKQMHSQTLCQNCVNAATSQFTCNNQNCNGFTMPTGLPNQLNGVQCIQNNSNCYYLSNTTSNLLTYLFCNYTFPQCIQCQNSSTCANCVGGYYLLTFDVVNSYANCFPCTQSIPGCQMCSGQSNCTQCYYQYFNFNGYCYSDDGQLASGIDPFSSGGSTAAQIIMDCLIFIIAFIAAFLFYLFFIQGIFQNSSKKNNKKQSKKALKPQPQTQILLNPKSQRVSEISEMKYPHEMVRQSLNRYSVRDQIAEQQKQKNDEIVKEQEAAGTTERGILKQ